MGREVRRVPPDWEHPKKDDGSYIPLFPQNQSRDYEREISEWHEGRRKWVEGFRRDYSDDNERWMAIEEKYKSMRYTDWAGEPPNPDDFMPKWTPEEATHYQMYEDTSEGTPISPVFATPEELARWLADNNASSFADMTATYEQWLRVCQGSWAPSMVIDNNGVRSGVEI